MHKTDMALVSCWQCDREISEFATTCPGCGGPVPDQNAGSCIEATFGCLMGIAWLIAGLAALMFLIVLLLGFFIAIV